MNLAKFKKTQVERHPLHKFFKNYNLNAVAEEVGNSLSWIRIVLGGHQKPSKELDQKLYALADALKAAEAEAEITEASA